MKFSQPAFDGEFGILIAGICVALAVAVYGIAHFRAKRRWNVLAQEIQSFNDVRTEIRYGYDAMKHYHIGYKHAVLEGLEAQYIDFYMRIQCPEDNSDSRRNRNVYVPNLPYPRPLTRCEEICMEMLILDHRGIAIQDAKVFVFYYINSSWAESMDYFFSMYQSCLLYHWRCDPWDTSFFHLLPSMLKDHPDIIGKYRQHVLALRSL